MATPDLPESAGSSAGREEGKDIDRRRRRAASPAAERQGQRRPKGMSFGWLVSALLLGLFVGGVSATFVGSGSGEGDPFAGQIRSETYQAVILSNDKVYFGRLRSVSDDFYQLRSAFFLREARDDANSEPVRALEPLSREIHAPENSMLIRRDEVVVVENLGEDSPILAEIRRQNRSEE